MHDDQNLIPAAKWQTPTKGSNDQERNFASLILGKR